MSILAVPSYNVVLRLTATEKNSLVTMLSYIFILSVHAVGTLHWRGSSLIPPVYQPVTSSNAIYSHLSVGIITTDRSEPSVDWRIRCCCKYTSNCFTTEDLTGVLYYKTPIQQFCFFIFNWRVYLLQKEGKKGNTIKNRVSTSYLRKKMEQNSDSSW